MLALAGAVPETDIHACTVTDRSASPFRAGRRWHRLFMPSHVVPLSARARSQRSARPCVCAPSPSPAGPNAKTSGRALVRTVLFMLLILGHTVQCVPWCVLVQVMGTTGTVLSERVRTRWGSKRSAGGVGSSFHSPLLSTICVCVLRCCSLHACSLVCEAGSFSNFLLSVNDNHYRCKFSSRPPFLAPVRLSC